MFLRANNQGVDFEKNPDIYCAGEKFKVKLCHDIISK